MCFHSKQSKKAQTVEKRFNAKIEDVVLFESQTEFNGFTFPKTPIITNQTPSLIQHYNWGLIPGWSKDENIRQYTLNTRIETIKEKPSFKNYLNNRCLILSDGFYEWKWLDLKGNKKQKHLISLPNEDVYAYAGIYYNNTYSIVTTEANNVVAEIHRKKRMPVILKPEDELNWLHGGEIKKYKFPYEVNLKAINIESQQTLFFE